MSTVSRWLNWTPSRRQTIEAPPEVEPTKPSKLGFEGFDGSGSKENPIIQPTGQSEPVGPIIEETLCAEPTEPSKFRACPYNLPAGLRLLRYTPKSRPVKVTACSSVNDAPKFIQQALAELDARLHHPVQIKAGDSVFALLSKLGDCGLELTIEWPPEKPGEIKADTPPAIAASPSAHGLEITGEDIPR